MWKSFHHDEKGWNSQNYLFWKKKISFFLKFVKNLSMCCYAGIPPVHRGHRWRVPPVSRQSFYEHSSWSLCTFTREHCNCVMWSSSVKIQSLCPEDSWEDHFLTVLNCTHGVPRSLCEVNTSPQLGQWRHITIPVMGWLTFFTLGSWEEPCMAMVLQEETVLGIRTYP